VIRVQATSCRLPSSSQYYLAFRAMSSLTLKFLGQTATRAIRSGAQTPKTPKSPMPCHTPRTPKSPMPSAELSFASAVAASTKSTRHLCTPAHSHFAGLSPCAGSPKPMASDSDPVMTRLLSAAAALSDHAQNAPKTPKTPKTPTTPKTPQTPKALATEKAYPVLLGRSNPAPAPFKPDDGLATAASGKAYPAPLGRSNPAPARFKPDDGLATAASGSTGATGASHSRRVHFEESWPPGRRTRSDVQAREALLARQRRIEDRSAPFRV